jgi:outer membrane lipoprotein-sorting protein
MKNKIKLLVIVVAFFAFCISGCASALPDGTEEISAFIETASKFDSARYLVTNLHTDITEQVFSFMYDENGREIFLLEESDGENITYMYYDGEKITDQNGHQISSDTNFTRENPYPMGNGSMLFFAPDYIKSAKTYQDSELNTVYEYTYNAERLNKDLNADYESFITSWVFDNAGDFLLMSRQTVFNSGEIDAIQVEIFNINAVSEIAP